MSAPDLLQPLHLMSFVHFGCEFSTGVGERQNMLSGDDDFAKRNQNAVDGTTVCDAGEPTSEVSANHGIHDVSRQADNVRQKRFCNNHTHSEFPPHERGLSCVVCPTQCNRNFLYIPPEFYQPSFMFREWNAMHSNVHSGTNCIFYGFRRDFFARSSASATTTAIANAASAKPSTIQNSHHIQNPNSACESVGRSIAPVRRAPGRFAWYSGQERPSTHSVSTGGPARDVETAACPILLIHRTRRLQNSEFTGGPNLGEATAIPQWFQPRSAAVAPILRRAAA